MQGNVSNVEMNESRLELLSVRDNPGTWWTKQASSREIRM